MPPLPPPAPGAGPPRRPALGYAMVLAAATLFAVNGVVSKVILSSGLSALRLTEVRLTGAALLLLAGLALTRRRLLELRRREIPFFLLFGIGGLALVQLTYFLAIRRLEIGIALLLQYLAPLIVALWARFGERNPVRRRIWIALALALGGLALVVDLWRGTNLDGVGVVAALAASLTYALYIVLAERGVGERDPVSLSCYGFVFGAAFWACIQPWWSFPGTRVAERVSLLGNLAGVEAPVWLLMACMVVLGTIVPFGLFVGALRHLPATRVAIVAMVEPVVATAVAFVWLDERLTATQVLGGAVVLAGVALAQTAR